MPSVLTLTRRYGVASPEIADRAVPRRDAAAPASAGLSQGSTARRRPNTGDAGIGQPEMSCTHAVGRTARRYGTEMQIDVESAPCARSVMPTSMGSREVHSAARSRHRWAREGAGALQSYSGVADRGTAPDGDVGGSASPPRAAAVADAPHATAMMSCSSRAIHDAVRDQRHARARTSIRRSRWATGRGAGWRAPHTRVARYASAVS